MGPVVVLDSEKTAAPLAGAFTDCASGTEIPQSECEALVALYYATDGENWINSTDWLATDTPCSWYGVSCTDGYVQSLNLSSNNLSGSIPTELGNLTYLATLYLNNNPLSGSLPVELTSLVNLQDINFSETDLCMPTNETFQIWIAAIPTKSVTENCSVAFTDCSAVTGIPESECNALTTLYNSTNGTNWTDNTDWLSTDTPCTWFGVSCSEGHVQSLSLSANNLSGSIPSGLGNLTYLTTLLLNGNQLTGSVPSTMGNLTQLTALYLHDNQLSGSLPTGLTNLVNLVEINFTGTSLCMPPTKIFQAWIEGIPTRFVTTYCATGGFIDCSLVNGITESECEGLTALYDSARNGGSWTDKPNWLSTNAPCFWEGVGCVNGHVESLNLSESELMGTLPAELGNLTYLKELSLDHNYLTGTIPAEIWNLTNLVTLELYVNELEGEIPKEIGNLVNLTTLDLDSNQLSGTIPEEIGSLTNLTRLWLSNNQFTGTIPTELGNLTKLTSLGLLGNQLSGEIPTELGNLTLLTELDLGENAFTGSIPVELGNLTQLTKLHLGDDLLEGSVPAEMGNLINLEYLYLYNNLLSGSLPLELTNLTNLQWINFAGTSLCMPADEAFQTWIVAIPTSYVTTNCSTAAFTSCSAVIGMPKSECNALSTFYTSTKGASWTDDNGWFTNNAPCLWKGVGCANGYVQSLVLSDNNLAGTIPTAIGNLPYLTELYLDQNKLTGTIPTTIGNLSNLRYLVLMDNSLTGTIPSQIGNLANLVVLDLDSNQLSGRIPYQLGDLSNLTELWLHSNKLSDTIPGELVNLSNLTVLDLGNNQISGQIIPDMDYLDDLVYLDLSENELEFNIPDSVWYLDDLKELYLHGNHLAGKISSDIGYLSDLEVISLYSNRFTGTIPYSIGNLTKLTALYLDDNQLSGEIPEELGNLTNLTELTLGANQLSGVIPAELGNLTNLSVLGLGYNALSGSIPSELGNLTNLAILSLYDNKLIGSVPAEFGNLTNLTHLYIDSNPLAGSLPLELTNLVNLERFYFAGTTLCMPTDTAFQNWIASIPYTAVTKNCVMVTTLSSISPNYSFINSPTFTLTVIGADFQTNSEILWDDTALPTNFQSGTKLTAQVPARHLLNSDQVAITVYTSGMATETSSSVIHTIVGYSPSYDQRLATNKVIFDWDDISGANLYTIQLSLSKTFGSYVVNTTTPSSKFTYGTALTNGKTYYWRIRARFGLTWKTWSPTLQFKSMTPPVAPTVISPANGFLTNDNTVDFSWNTVTNGVKYQLQISKSTTFSPNLVDQVLEEGITSYSTDSLTDGKYYWRVRAIDDIGTNGLWSASRLFTVDTIAPAIPELYTPKNNISTPDTTPSLVVTAVGGAKTYHFQLSNVSDFSNVVWEKTTTSTIATVSARPYDVYYWRAKAIDAAGNGSDWSAVCGLVVTFQKAPAEAAFTTDTTPLFTWIAVGGAKGYELEVTPEVGGDSYKATLGLVTSHTVPAASLLPVGKYTWVLRVQLENTWFATPARRLTITPPLLKAPVLVSPANGFATQNRTPTLEWRAVTDGSNEVRYEVWLDNSTAFTSREYEAIFTEDITQVTLTSELTDGRYYWKMRSINYLDVPGLWSTYRSILIDNVPPNAPKLYTPANNVTVRGTPKFTWYAVSGAKYYQFQITSTAETPVVVQSADNLTVTYYKPAILDPGKYTWQVRARDAAGNWSGWSTARTITIRPVIPAAPALLSPANGATVTISAPEFTWNSVPYGDIYQIQISSSSTFTTTIENKTLESGILRFTSENPFSNGTYYWRVRAKNSIPENGAWSAVWNFKVSQ
ncbi:MAG: hypothetical protein LLG42_12775 [Chloroflexi bacterium]|nr:hypothetical protein [Chloroflexota bacterium]